ncbi:hypothetical protein E4U41_000359 [Claviceps citrina]|nr:hypothetical protein E4U41_000359 [Claviceps citrina]
MSGFKDIVKNGWHPEKSGTSIRGSVSGLMGRNKDAASADYSGHVSRPLTELKDPASFAPPPRRTGPGSAPGPPPPVSTQRKVIPSPSTYVDPRADPLETPPRRHGADGRSPPPYSGEVSRTAPASKAVPPSLPPRLPPRGATSSQAGDERGHGLLNGASVHRLGAAGVSVPALGIGRGGAATSGSSDPPPPAAAARPSAGSGAGKWTPQVNELQGRFAKMGTSSPAPSAQEPPAQGTTWAQKQAALKTASDFHKNPSSVSFSDARAAASTANNFRQRHGEQVASGVRTANSLNQKYSLMDKVSSAYTGSPLENTPAPASATSGGAGKKKPPPPPPPPKKKPGLAAAPANSTFTLAADEDGSLPPPIPVSTRPAF